MNGNIIFIGGGFALGLTGGLAGAAEGSLEGLTNAELNELIGDSQRALLRELFGQGEEGALSQLQNLQAPEGLTSQTLEIYQEIAQRVVQAGPNAPGYAVQSLRLQIVQQLLQGMK